MLTEIWWNEEIADFLGLRDLELQDLLEILSFSCNISTPTWEMGSLMEDPPKG